SRGSLRSLRPSSSSSSLVISTLPQWAKVYYRGGPVDFQASALSLIQGSRTSSIHSFVAPQIPKEIRQPPVAISHAPTEITRPRTRPREGPQLAIEPAAQPEPQRPAPRRHPADPRS